MLELYSSDMPILTLSAHFRQMKLRYDNLQNVVAFDGICEISVGARPVE